MLKYNGIFIYLLFTMTVAQDATISELDNSSCKNRMNITSEKTKIKYDLKDITNSDVERLMNDDSKIIDNKHKYITAINLPTKADTKHHEKLFDIITDDNEMLNKYSDSNINKLSKPPDVKYKNRGRKLLEPRVVETTTKVETKFKKNTRGKSYHLNHKNKQKKRKREQEYKTAEHTSTSSYGFRNVKQIDFDFDLPLSRHTTEFTTRPSYRRKTSQILKNRKNLSSMIRQDEIYDLGYKMNLNINKKENIEPNLNLKKPEYHVNFPALHHGQEIGHINRPIGLSGQSLVDAPTLNQNNLINIRRMFDTRHRHKEDSELNEVYKSTIVNTNTDNSDKSSISLVVDPNDKKPKRNEILVNLKLNFDTIKKIFSYPFDTINDAMSNKVNKKNKKPSIVSFKNKTTQVRSRNDSKNNQNKTTANSKNIDTNKLKLDINNSSNANDNKLNQNVSRVSLKGTNYDDIRNGSVHKNKITEKPKNIDTTIFKLISEIKNDYNMNISNQFTKVYTVVKTPPVIITTIYQSDARKQYNDFDNTYDIQSFINTKIDVASKTDVPQIEYYPTRAEIYQVTDENQAETKSEEVKTQRRFVPKYFVKGSGFGARVLPGYIFELQSYKKINNVPIEVKNKTKMAKKDDIVNKGIFRFTTRIDRFQFLRQIMNRINF